MILSHTHQSYLGIDWFPRDFAVPPWIMVRLDFHVKNQFWYTHCWMALYFFLCIFQIIIEVKICFFFYCFSFLVHFFQAFPEGQAACLNYETKVVQSTFPTFFNEEFLCFSGTAWHGSHKKLEELITLIFCQWPR